jgi:hypothetical protein
MTTRAMSFTQIEADRNVVREEVLSYLRANREDFVLSQPERWPVGSNMASRMDYLWRGQTSKVGKPLNDFANEVYQRLLSSGKARCTNERVHDNTEMDVFNAYYRLHVRFVILEEIFELIRAGVLINVKFEPMGSCDFKFGFGRGWVVLTDYGAKFVTETLARPYFFEQYLDVLRQTAEPDDVLQGYLSEGLACLRSHLGRAAAVLLRLAAEHTLNLLINSTKASIQDAKKRNSLEQKVKRAGMRIEERAEVIFRKLESEPGLVPRKDAVTNRLRPAFHSIRDLGGRAAHLSSPIRLKEVSDHYTLYEYSVYAISMRIIQHQKTMEQLRPGP